MPATTDPRFAASSPNQKVQAYIEEIVCTAYGDVLQRVPTGEEFKGVCNPCLLRLDGVTQLYLRLLCSAEFLSRFAFILSPLMIARLLINQVAGQGPKSAMDVEELAAKLLSSGWCPFIEGLMHEARVQEHVFAEMQAVALRAGLATPNRGEASVKPTPDRPASVAARVEPVAVRRSRVRDRSLDTGPSGFAKQQSATSLTPNRN